MVSWNPSETLEETLHRIGYILCPILSNISRRELSQELSGYTPSYRTIGNHKIVLRLDLVTVLLADNAATQRYEVETHANRSNGKRNWPISIEAGESAGLARVLRYARSTTCWCLESTPIAGLRSFPESESFEPIDPVRFRTRSRMCRHFLFGQCTIQTGTWKNTRPFYQENRQVELSMARVEIRMQVTTSLSRHQVETIGIRTVCMFELTVGGDRNISSNGTVPVSDPIMATKFPVHQTPHI